MVNFFTGAANFVEGAGFKTFEELASSVESGAVGGKREGPDKNFQETEAIKVSPLPTKPLVPWKKRLALLEFVRGQTSA